MNIAMVKMHLMDKFHKTVLDDMMGPVSFDIKDGELTSFAAYTTGYDATLDELGLALELSTLMNKRGLTMFSFYELNEQENQIRWGGI